MYQPDHFRAPDLPQMRALMRAKPFATLISAGPAGLQATHLPTVLRDDEPDGVIECHLARANPHWKDLAEGNEALLIFHGPVSLESRARKGRADLELCGGARLWPARDDQRQGLAAQPRRRAHDPAGKERGHTVGAVGCTRDLHRSHVARHRGLP